MIHLHPSTAAHAAVRTRPDLRTEYDTLDRRTKLIYPEGETHLYTYNQASDLIAETDPNATEFSYTHDRLSRRTEARVDLVSPGSNVINTAGPDPVQTFAYDGLDRLTAAVDASASDTGAAAPHDDNRVTDYVHFRRQCVEERDPRGGETRDPNHLLRQYVWGDYIDELIQQREFHPGDPDWFRDHYLLSDLHYRAVALTDRCGGVVEGYETDAYGRTHIACDAFDAVRIPVPRCAHLFTGRYLDAETGLHYFRARHYHPALGRFMQRDPKGYEEGANLYEFVSGDPTTMLDPSGQISGVPISLPGDPTTYEVDPANELAPRRFNPHSDTWEPVTDAHTIVAVTKRYRHLATQFEYINQQRIRLFRSVAEIAESAQEQLAAQQAAYATEQQRISDVSPRSAGSSSGRVLRNGPPARRIPNSPLQAARVGLDVFNMATLPAAIRHASALSNDPNAGTLETSYAVAQAAGSSAEAGVSALQFMAWVSNDARFMSYASKARTAVGRYSGPLVVIDAGVQSYQTQKVVRETAEAVAELGELNREFRERATQETTYRLLWGGLERGASVGAITREVLR